MTTSMDRKAVAHELDRIAAFLEIKRDNVFRVRAYRNAARIVNGLTKPLDLALEDGSLAATKGIGRATLESIRQIAASGRSSLLDQLRGEVPPGLVDMLAISGLGVAKIHQIYETLGIDTLPELEAAALDGRLAGLPRFGEKTASNIARSIGYLRQAHEFKLSHHAADEGQRLVAALARVPGVLSATLAGEIRRRCELVGDITILLVAEARPQEIFTHLDTLPGVHEFAGHDDRRATIHFAGGSSATIVVTPPANAGMVLVQTTGSRTHLAALETHAKDRGYSMEGAALWRGSTFVPTPTEDTVYQTLGLTPIPPELREGSGELAAARDGTVPVLVEQGDLRGVLHCHTPYSDGSHTIQELAAAAFERGYQYLGVTDHSPTAAYAGGLSADDLARQGDEVDRVNQAVTGIRVLKGVEADILADGTLDYDATTLARLDFVIASIHSRLDLAKEAMTERLLAAMDNPYVTIIGHPTGRMLLARRSYDVDLDTIFEKAAARGVALEINADPHRLDLDWRVVRRAREAGVVISIGADAHSAAGLDNVIYGIGIARKGWLSAVDVLNTRSTEAFLAFAHHRRTG